jgi:nucleoside-diphosphate kinase
MTGNITFTMIKPEAVADENIGPILSKITQGGFRIVAMKLTKFNLAMAQLFYGVHKDRPFFGELTAYITSGPVVVAILEKENAVVSYRELIGNTDPQKAAEGTIRKLFAKSMSQNAVHGSDSDENAQKESDFFFSKTERFTSAGNYADL